jgi:hypothetical protein
METHWEFLTVWTLVRVRWLWWVVQAKTRFALLGGAHGKAVPLLADPDLFGDTAVRVIAWDTVLLANPVQEAIHNLKGDPLRLAVTLQLHDLLDCAVVRRSGLGVVVVESVQDLADLLGVGASLLLELSLMVVAVGRLIIQQSVRDPAVWHLLVIRSLGLIDDDLLRHVLLHPWHRRDTECVERSIGIRWAEVA